MHPHSRLVAGTLLSIGWVVLGLEWGDRTSDAARHPATRAETREEPPRRMDASSTQRAEPDAATRERVNDQYGRLPLGFERNDGQTDPRVAFLSRGPGYALFLSAGGEACSRSAARRAQQHAPRSRRPVSHRGGTRARPCA